MKSSPALIVCLVGLSFTVAHAASDVSVTTAATSGGTFSGGNPNVFTPTGATAVVNSNDILTTLNANTPVTVNTASPASGNGDLRLTSSITRTVGGQALLTFNAARDLLLEAAITGSGGSIPLSLNAGRAITSSQAITTRNQTVAINTVQPFALGNSLNAGTAQISLLTGSLESLAAQTVTASSVQVSAGAAWKQRGTLSGNLSVGGTLSPAPTNTASSLQVNGTLTLQSTATTIVDLAGTSQGSNYDSITSTGAVTIAGALQLNFLSGFENLIVTSNTFTILSGSSVTGIFTGLPNNSRITLPNELGSIKITYNATNVVLSDWQPYIRDLAWDPGTNEAGTEILNQTNTRSGRHYFRINTQSTDIGAWRSRLTVTSGEADLYLQTTSIPQTITNYTHRSILTGGDGLVLRSDQYTAGQTWYFMVNATAGSQWSLVSGRAWVQDLGGLAWTDSNSNGTYDIGEPVLPSGSGAGTVPLEGIRFFKTSVPAGTPAWSLWLNGSTRDIAVRKSFVPFHSATSYYNRKQSGQMLVVAPYLTGNTSTYFLSVTGNPGEAVNLDSRIQEVQDMPFNSTVNAVSVPTTPYRVYRVQVPVQQIAWDVAVTPSSGDANVCVRRDNAPAEFDNDAFSEVTGTTSDSITLVPDFLTDATWFITVYGNSAYTFTLKNGSPTITPLSFTDTKLNDQTTRAGWRFYTMTDVPSQLGSLGWELNLANQVPGTEIAIRRNAVPSRWRSRVNGSTGISTPSRVDASGTGGFLQRPGHQADIWYVGIYTPTQALGSFTLTSAPMLPTLQTFDGGVQTFNNQEPGRFNYVRIDVPAGVLGWDLRLTNVTGPTPQMVVRRDQLPNNTTTTTSFGSGSLTWPSGNQWAAGSGSAADWTDWTNNPGSPNSTASPRLLMGLGRPLEPGTYYVGVYNGSTTTATSYGIVSRGIGNGQTYLTTDLVYAGGSATISNLAPREAQYFKVTIPANTPSWEVTLSPIVGEMLLAVRRGTIPDFSSAINGSPGSASGSLQTEMQKAGPERYVMLPQSGQDFIPAGDYFLAAVSEGVNPGNITIGTGSSSGTLTSVGPLAVTNLGTANATGTTQPVNLAGGQVKAHQVNIPVGTASLEVRLDNRVGNPRISLTPSIRLPYPNATNLQVNEYGIDGGSITGRVVGDEILTIANPTPGVYSIIIQATAVGSLYPDASANLVVIANAPIPLAFDAGNTSISNQSAGAWRYFQVEVPPGVLGWDVRLINVTGPMPQMLVRRDQLPNNTTTTTSFGSGSLTWPSGNQWAAGSGSAADWTDWTNNPGSPNSTASPRLLMGLGRPLEPGTYYVGVYNGSTTTATSYGIVSRGIGNGQTYLTTDLVYAGGSATISNLAPREAKYFKVTIPTNTPSWEVTLSPSAGEMMLAVRRGTIPDFTTDIQGEAGATSGTLQIEMQKAGPERYVMLPPNGQDFLIAGDYYLAAISEGVNPGSQVIGSGTSSGILASVGPLVVTHLGSANAASIIQAVSLAGGQVKAYQFNVPVGIASLEVRLDSRVGNPRISLKSGSRLPFPRVSNLIVDTYGNDGGDFTDRTTGDEIVTVANPTPGIFSIAVQASAVGSLYPDASTNLVVRTKPNTPLNFAASQNTNGGTHTDTRQMIDGEYTIYEVPVPTSVDGQPVTGWVIKTDVLQGAVSLEVYKNFTNPTSGASVTGGFAVIVPPFLTFGESWYVRVKATGLTNYTLTSRPVTLERPVWQTPTTFNQTFGDSGNDSGGNPLPGDRGTDLGQGEWHFYAVDVPAGNLGLLRTELQAISGNPDLYIREDGVPTTSHDSNGNASSGSNLYNRQLTATTTEYGNWVPLDGRTQRQLTPGRWHLGVRAAGNSNVRYRLAVSTGQVTDLALNGGSLTNQNLADNDWRFYRFTVPSDAPVNWALTFSQQVGDVVMWLRDAVPPGQNSGNNSTSYIESWSSDSKNQGPYSNVGHDAAGIYTFTTPPLRPGQTYYAGFRSNSSATFSVSSATSGGTIGTLPVLDFYTGTLNTSIPANSSVLYRIPAPEEATRMKWTSTHASTVQLRLEQGSIPISIGTTQHYFSSAANSVFNNALSTTTWPWQPNQSYYLRIVNNAATAATVTLSLNGKNAANEDEDNDGLLDAWEKLYFNNSITSYSGTSDPDGDGSTNTTEFADGTLPNDAASAKYTLTLTASGGTISKSLDLPKYFKGTVITLTAIPSGAPSFIGWSGALSGSTNPADLTLIANASVAATFGIPLANSLDTTGLVWTQGGNAPWFGQSTTTRDATDAAQSGAIGHSQESWMETTITGPGTLTFWWKVSSQSGGDYLEFHLDGILQTGRISGTVDWVQKSYSLTAGTHALRWRYLKNASTVTGSDAAWVDQVLWTSTDPYSTWQSGFFNPTQLANPAISGPTIDFDNDGIPNLLEYLLGGNPTLPSSGLLPTVSKAPGSSSLVFTYKRKIAVTGVTQVIEHATSLSQPWIPAAHGASGVTINTAPVPGDVTTEQVTVTIPSTSASRFVRLKATRP